MSFETRPLSNFELVTAQKGHPWDIGKALWKMLHQTRRANHLTYKNDEQYFLENVAYGLSDCWYWIGSLDPSGYGIWSYGKKTRAHRAVFELWGKKIPENMLVLHICDARNCVNPDHLYLGDQRQNVHDMMARGRFVSSPRYGEKNPMAKLSREKIEIAKKRRNDGVSYKQIAHEMGFSTMTIFRALTGRSWQ